MEGKRKSRKFSSFTRFQNREEKKKSSCVRPTKARWRSSSVFSKLCSTTVSTLWCGTTAPLRRQTFDMWACLKHGSCGKCDYKRAKPKTVCCSMQLVRWQKCSHTYQRVNMLAFFWQRCSKHSFSPLIGPDTWILFGRCLAVFWAKGNREFFCVFKSYFNLLHVRHKTIWK